MLELPVGKFMYIVYLFLLPSGFSNMCVYIPTPNSRFYPTDHLLMKIDMSLWEFINYVNSFSLKKKVCKNVQCLVFLKSFFYLNTCIKLFKNVFLKVSYYYIVKGWKLFFKTTCRNYIFGHSNHKRR